VEEVINIKVNVEAQAKRSAYPGTPGIHRQTAFCILSPVFCPTRPSYQACQDFNGSIAQNKPNVKMGNINISPAQTKTYANEQRTMSKKRHSKQTQSNPIPPPCRGEI